MPEQQEPILVCRCEEVMRDDVIAAIHEGCRTLDEIKRMTRAGMGRCQGRCCGPIMASLLSKEAGIPRDQIAPLTAQFPLDIIGMDSLVRLDCSDSERAEPRGGTR